MSFLPGQRELVALVAYLAALTAAVALTILGKLDTHVVALVIGAAIPGPGSLFARGTTIPPPPPPTPIRTRMPSNPKLPGAAE